jgi:hypothetical protein
MYILRFDNVRCVFLLFYVLMKHIILCVNIVFGNTFTFCTDIPFAVHFNCAGKNPAFIREELQHMTIVPIFFNLSYFGVL